ncbi:16S rRNA processing protein RimM [Fulvivirga sp. 29W222]|uniref:Ribosome maturation factor RimM n=1 Tax=Fulvivirga marina TaxID=2494733 RepID=A0A937G321_9BACT|nr:ribosome maturation factor RimM [Fulvivirga marina]MBL6449772.1 16S rRNA processing protein RimM [Fulvivirga marina]
MNVGECFQLGYVIKKHGLSGEVSIILDVDVPHEYQELESVFVEINDKLVPFFIESISIKGNKAIVRFEDVNTLEQADELKGKGLFLPLSMLPELDDDKFYYHQVMGYHVIDTTAGDVGVIVDVYTSPNQDLLAIDHRGKEVLVPINDEIIGKVDHEKSTLNVNLPEGLLDIYLD